MQKTYSRTGCVTCKQRRKKCDEARPRCDACARLDLECSYDRNLQITKGKRGLQHLGTFQVFASSALPLAPSSSSATYSKSDEMDILLQIPSTVTAFFSASYQQPDVPELLPLTLESDLLRTVSLAAYAMVVPAHHHVRKKIDPKIYGRALNLLTEHIASAIADKTVGLSLLLSVLTFGLIESVTSEASPDPQRHWRGLAALVAHSGLVDPHSWPATPLHLKLQLLESLAYHLSAFALFSQDIEATMKAWNNSGVLRNLEFTNPRGPHRVPLSPILSGQYIIYRSVLMVTYIHRCRPSKYMTAEYLDRLTSTVSEQEASLEGEFSTLTYISNSQRVVLRRTYELFCNALRICVITLQAPTPARTQQLAGLVAQNLRIFLELPALKIQSACVTWPIQITAMALWKNSELQMLVDRFAHFRSQLDAGHARRTQHLFSSIADLQERRAAQQVGNDDRAATEENEYPAALKLLQNRKGILAA